LRIKEKLAAAVPTLAAVALALVVRALAVVALALGAIGVAVTLALALALAVRRLLRVQLDTTGSAVAYGAIGHCATP
jgi:hypothetical protein